MVAAEKDVTLDAAVSAVLSELDGILMLKNDVKRH